MSAHSRFSLFLTSSAMLALAACGGGAATDNSESARVLGTNKAPYQLVEEEKQPNPVQDHMAARGKVDPSPQADASKYTSPGKMDDSAEPMHFRVLKLERQMSGLQDDFDKLLTPLQKVKSDDDQLSKTIDEIKARQQQAAAEHMAMYTAPAANAASPDEPLKMAPPPPAPTALEQEQAAQEKMTSDAAPAAAAPVPEASAPEPAPPDAEVPASAADQPQAAAAPPPAQGAIAITGVRVGEHPGKVRVVLDVSGPVKFSADLDNDEKVLLIDLPGAAWTGDAKKVLKSTLVHGYTAQTNAQGDGTTLAIELSAPAKLAAKAALGPSGNYGHRIMIDLAPL